MTKNFKPEIKPFVSNNNTLIVSTKKLMFIQQLHNENRGPFEPQLDKPIADVDTFNNEILVVKGN